jgi:hypothetical protein
MLKNIFSYIEWPQGYGGNSLKMDILTGLTVALVLTPQSMAYAELAGLPPYYGLYASFLPPMIAALFGSSRQLATGPVAVVSLLTATTLAPLATAGSQQYIAYAVLLALLVGVFQFALGALKLGLVVNFISHPVVNGFTNAAVVITTILSWGLGFERNVVVDIAALHSEQVKQAVTKINLTIGSIAQMTAKRAELIHELNLNRTALDSHAKLDIRHAAERLALRIEQYKEDAADYRSQIRSFLFNRVRGNHGGLAFYQVNEIAGVRKKNSNTLSSQPAVLMILTHPAKKHYL